MLEKALEKFIPIDEDAISTFKADVDATVPLHENLDPIKNKPRDILPNDKFHFSIEEEELKPGTLRIFNVHASDLYSWTGCVWLREANINLQSLQNKNGRV